MVQLLGDIGGLISIIISFFGLIYSVLNYQRSENFLVSLLYTSQRKQDLESDISDQAYLDY